MGASAFLTTDREKLEAALARADKVAPTLCDDSKLIVEAARKHLATLPAPSVLKWKVTHGVEGFGRRTWSDGWETRSQAANSARNALEEGRCTDVSISEYYE